MSEINWVLFKQFVDSKELEFQYIQSPTHYDLIAFDGPFKIETRIIKSSPPRKDQIDFETNYQANGNNRIDQLGHLKAFCGKITCDQTGVGTLDIPIPGEVGKKGARLIVAGEGWFDTYHPDDQMTEIGIAHPQAGMLAEYLDREVANEMQGRYFPPSGVMRIEAPTKMGSLVGGLLLRISVKKGDGSAGVFRFNIDWAE